MKHPRLERALAQDRSPCTKATIAYCKGYQNRTLMLNEILSDQGLYLQTPLRENMKEERPRSFLQWILGARRLVEAVIGQLTERFHIEKVRARDIWHQASRFWREILAHTLCVKINLSLGNEPLQFEKLLAA